MLMDETCERYGHEQTEKSEDNIMNIGNNPVMQSAIDVLTMLGNKSPIIFRSEGNSNSKCSSSCKYYH